MTAYHVGFQKLAFPARLGGAAIGAGLGFLAAPEGHGAAGAVAGAGLGYGAGAVGSRLHGHFAAPKAPMAAPAAAGAPHVPPGYSPQEMASAHHEIDQHLSPSPMSPGPQAKGSTREGYAPGSMPPPGEVLSPERQKNLAKIVAPARMRPVQLPMGYRPQPTTASLKVGFGKLADYGLNVSPQGIGATFNAKDERLEGMNHWVPRRTMEQAYQGVDQGLDETALINAAGEGGNIRDPLAGAGIGAAMAHYGLGKNPWLTGAGALVGAGAGAMYNHATRDARQDDMSQALKGVYNEKRRAQHTAHEARPVVVSTNGDT